MSTTKTSETDAQADQCLRVVHMSFYCFCSVAAHLILLLISQGHLVAGVIDIEVQP